MPSVNQIFTVLSFLLFSITTPGHAESLSGSSETISFLALTGLFLSLDQPTIDTNLFSAGSFEKEQALANNPYPPFSLICCPKGFESTESPCKPPDNSNSEVQNSAGSFSNSRSLAASCFLTTLGKGDDDPEEPNEEEEDEESPVSGVCPICLEALSEKKMELTHCCGRLFHAACLTQCYLTGEQPLRCPCCRSSPFFYQYKPPSVAAVPGRRPLRCNHCRSTFRYLNRLNNHLRLQHNYCWICPVEIGNHFDIEEHNLEHGFPNMCAICNFPTNSANDLYTHITHNHSFHSPRHDCSCFGQTIPYGEMLQMGARHYQCSVCSTLSHSYEEYMQHMQTHLPYHCLCCSSRFATDTDLRSHFPHCSTSESDN